MAYTNYRKDVEEYDATYFMRTQGSCNQNMNSLEKY